MTKLSIPILLGSCRIGRESLKVAKFILAELVEQDRIETELIDLAEYKLPMLAERLEDSSNPPENVLKFCSKLGQADGILLVTPEYKNGYPGVLKNALDYLEPKALKYKPIGICSVSSGILGGLDCLGQLRLVCLALGGLPIPDKLPVTNVKELFHENGNLSDLKFQTRLEYFINELVWYTEAIVNQKQSICLSKKS